VPGLRTRKLLILYKARNAKNAQIAEMGYTAGTRGEAHLYTLAVPKLLNSEKFGSDVTNQNSRGQSNHKKQNPRNRNGFK
jgi:hypothetical protein